MTTKEIQDAFKVSPERAAIALGIMRTKGAIALSKPSSEWIWELLPKTEKWERQCFNPPNTLELKMHALNELLDCCGVECVHPEDDFMYQDIWCEYLNTGDTYSTTIVFRHATGEFSLSCWGDELEAMEAEIKYGLDI